MVSSTYSSHLRSSWKLTRRPFFSSTCAAFYLQPLPAALNAPVGGRSVWRSLPPLTTLSQRFRQLVAPALWLGVRVVHQPGGDHAVPQPVPPGPGAGPGRSFPDCWLIVYPCTCTQSLSGWVGAWRTSPRHRRPFDSRNEGSKCVSMTWRAICAFVLNLGYPAPLELLLPNAGDHAKTCNVIFLLLRDRQQAGFPYTLAASSSMAWPLVPFPPHLVGRHAPKVHLTFRYGLEGSDWSKSLDSKPDQTPSLKLEQ